MLFECACVVIAVIVTCKYSIESRVSMLLWCQHESHRFASRPVILVLGPHQWNMAAVDFYSQRLCSA